MLPLKKQTDANNRTMRYSYDSFGRLLEVWSPYDTGTMPAVRYEYAWQGTNTFTGNWYAVTYNKINYDPADFSVMRTVMTVDGLSRSLQVAKDGEYRDEAGIRHYGWNVSGAVLYDSAGRTIKEGKPVFVEGASYPALGGLVRPLTKAYDSLDRVTQVTESDGSVVSMTYGIEQGKLFQKTIDPLMNASLQFSDARGNIVEVRRLDSAGAVLTKATYEYNALGEMLRAFDANMTPVTVTYDLLGRKTALESLDSGRIEFTYDAASNVIRKTDSVLRGKGEAITYVYDELNRLVKTDYPRSADVTYLYGGPEAASTNGAGRLLSVTDGTGTTSYSYGMLGEVIEKSRTIVRLTSFADPETASFSYVTNYLGQMDAITYPDGETIRYRYDRGGNLANVTGTIMGDYGPITTEYVKDIAYNPEGQRTYIEYANGVRTSYEYDEDRSWLTSIRTTNGVGYTFQNMSYSFDRVGNVLGYTNDATTYRTTQSYSYDSLYQLTGAQGTTLNKPTNVTGTYRQTYAFDSIGNMTTKMSSASANGSLPMGGDLNYNLDYAYYNNGKSHQAERIGNIWFRYDANGNVTEAREGGHSPVTTMSGTVGSTGSVSYVNYGFGLDRGASAAEDTAWKRTYAWNEENRMIRSVEKTIQVEYS